MSIGLKTFKLLDQHACLQKSQSNLSKKRTPPFSNNYKYETTRGFNSGVTVHHVNFPRQPFTSELIIKNLALFNVQQISPPTQYILRAK